MDRGIVLTGGGALLRGLDKRLRHETGMPVRIADTPLQAVVLGSGKCLEEFEVLQRVLVSPLPAVVRRGLPRSTPAARGSLVVVLVSISLAVITLDYRQGTEGPLAGLGRIALAAMAPAAGGRDHGDPADRRLLQRPGPSPVPGGGERAAPAGELEELLAAIAAAADDRRAQTSSSPTS